MRIARLFYILEAIDSGGIGVDNDMSSVLVNRCMLNDDTPDVVEPVLLLELGLCMGYLAINKGARTSVSVLHLLMIDSLKFLSTIMLSYVIVCHGSPRSNEESGSDMFVGTSVVRWCYDYTVKRRVKK